jgi:hypothetical protein
MAGIALQGNNSGSGSATIVGPNTDSALQINIAGADGTLAPMVSGTTTTISGTSVAFTDIPSWVKRITVMLNGVSTSGTSVPIIQLGSTSYITTGYLGTGGYIGTSAQGAAVFTTGFGISSAGAAADIRYGTATLTKMDDSTWAYTAQVSLIGTASAPYVVYGSGIVPVSGAVDRIRLTTVNGTDTFDAGSVNILYE